MKRGKALAAMLVLTLRFMERIRTMVITCAGEIDVLVSILIVIPMIFQSGWRSILFTWAPWSVLGGLISLSLSMLALIIKIYICIKNETVE